MAINYSLTARRSKPNEENSEMKVYAVAQYREILDLDALADHVQQHGSPFTADIILGVARKLVNCIVEELLNGNMVKLGKLGDFYVKIKSLGVSDAESFNSGEHIQKVAVAWKPSNEIKNRIQQASYNYVGTRKNQNESKKQEKQALNEIMAASTSGSTDDNENTGD